MTATKRHHGLAALPEYPTDPVEEHVVLATDGRAGTSAATHWVADRSRSHVLDVDIVHVVRESHGHPVAGVTAVGDDPTESARSHLAMEAPSAETRVRVLEGDPLAVLVDLGRAADLVVLGTRRRAGSTHLIAAFSTRLAESVRSPTIVVPDGWQRSNGPVVVGVMGDGSDTAAIDFAAHEASVLHRDLVLVHAWQLAPLVWPALEVDVEGHATAHGPAARLDAVADPLRERYPELGVVRILEHGAPIQALIHDARDASLLVVGRHGLSVVGRLMLGSTGRGVLERPACPVAVVPPHAS